MSDLATVENDVRNMDITMSPDDVLKLYDIVLFYQRGIKELRDRCEGFMIQYIKETGKDLDAGNGIRYVVGKTKTTKCNDVPATLEAIMQATGGDFARVCDTLSSNALKHGACKKMLPPDVYERLFRTETKEVLDEKGQATLKESLVKIDDAFVR